VSALSPLAARAVTITEFSATFFAEEGIATGPDGNLWITTEVATVGRAAPSGKVTGQFSLGDQMSTAYDITAGGDGAMWFVEHRAKPVAGPYIGRITMSGTVTNFPVPTAAADPKDITAGPDGNVWFTESGIDRIGRITPSGSITEFGGLRAGSKPDAITAGPDGNLWFTEASGSSIGRITTAGNVTEFPIGGSAAGIAAGADGNLWFTAHDSFGFVDTISRMSTSGLVTGTFRAASRSAPGHIAPGPDGNLWFSESGTGRIGRITPSGRITDYSDGITLASLILDVARGPGSTVWFVEFENKFARVELDLPAVTTGPASRVSQQSAEVTAQAAPLGTALSVHFEYGSTPAYGLTTPARNLGDGDGIAVTEPLSGLTPATTYHYRIVGSSLLGSVAGDDRTFTTASIPPPPPPPDGDGDGYPVTVDCNDGDPRLHPGATDFPRDGLDQDCSGGDAPYTAIGTTISATFAAGRRYTTFRSLTLLHAHAGSKVRVTCSGPGCPSRTRETRVPGEREILKLLPVVRRIRLGPRTTVEVEVTRPGSIGVIARWTGSGPRRTDLCLRPGSRKPAACSKVRG
jgi:streptogramin lyase